MWELSVAFFIFLGVWSSVVILFQSKRGSGEWGDDMLRAFVIGPTVGALTATAIFFFVM